MVQRGLAVKENNYILKGTTLAYRTLGGMYITSTMDYSQKEEEEEEDTYYILLT